MHVLPGGQAGADVEKLPDSRLGGKKLYDRLRKARAARADSAVLGKVLIAASAAILSASKLSVPPRKKSYTRAGCGTLVLIAGMSC
jgi:hypothetical protein